MVSHWPRPLPAPRALGDWNSGREPVFGVRKTEFKSPRIIRWCDPRQVTSPLEASICLSVKWKGKQFLFQVLIFN